jgi:hypothetical protein
MADAGVGHKLTGADVVDHLVDVAVDAPVGSSVKPSNSTWLEMATNCLLQ